jgi:4-amino-4-deoxy-L-arabinose transferase-like glycosyltransferase
MILKNIINPINMLVLIKFFIFIFIFVQFLTNSKIRHKFFFFTLLFIIINGIGLYYNLDGMVMMFTVCELGVILIFIITYSQIYLYDKKTEVKPEYYYFIYLFLLSVNINFYTTKLINFKNFYSFYSININDFYYIYNCYFEKQVFGTILISLILTLYSLFFIFLYFNFKKIQNIETKKKKAKNVVRKQNIMHQSNYKTTIRCFQNNK